MIDIIAKTRKAINFDGLHMRIGIHTGKIIGGVIGTDIIRFDLYGQDVVIANKMESNGSSDMINVSEYSKEHLSRIPNHPYRFQYNQDIEMKALNRSVKCYLLTKDEEDF